MTNEITASQPKSIGDANVQGWAEASGLPATATTSDIAKAVYKDSRAPAAQASATIQAGQWVRCTPDLINAGVECAHTPRRPGDGTYSHDHFIAHSAATIQEPVMVAEPVELVGIAEQIKEGAGFWHSCSGCYDTEDGHPTGPYAYSNAMRCALGSGCAECGGLGARWDNNDYSTEDAAPMVADPAGMVVDINALESLARVATPGPWKKGDGSTVGPISRDDDQSFGMVDSIIEISGDNRENNTAWVAAANPETFLKVIAMARTSNPSSCSDERPCIPCYTDNGRCDDLAATVKAVPSEALDEKILPGGFTLAPAQMPEKMREYLQARLHSPICKADAVWNRLLKMGLGMEDE